MTDQFLAEIRIFTFNFAPQGWALCDGQILPISQNTALFSLLGTTYGGDGKSTFALPDFQGRAPMHFGQGQGLTERFLGEEGGTDAVTLLQTEMPNHAHALQGNSALGDSPLPGATVPARPGSTQIYQSTTNANLVAMAAEALPAAGGGVPHNNLMPYVTLNFCIALQGIFPARS